MDQLQHPRAIPELYETSLAECLAARTKALAKYAVSLGPPDMCHVTKVQEKPQSLLRSGPAPPMLVGTYHYAYGVDCSSPAAIAAYFNTLVNEMAKPSGGPTKGSWKIQSGTYCCYNAFTRVDVRVEVTMPGSVNAYVLDAQGRRYGCDDRMWQEVLVSAVLRALKKPSSFSVHIEALRSFYPFQRPEDEEAFLRASRDLLWDGRFLGTDELTAPATVANNRLVQGVKEYLLSTHRYTKVCVFNGGLLDVAAEFFTPAVAKEPALAAVLAEIHAAFGQTAIATCLLATKLQETSMSTPMLLAQSKLLVEMGYPEEALKVAKYAIDVSPAQAQPWVNLAHVYTANKNYAMALVALNVAPMAHGPEFSMPDMPDPARTTSINEVIRDMVSEEEEGDQTLASLPANSLRGTFLDAYHVLTSMLKHMAWDELLMYRSQVFLMEDGQPIAHTKPEDDGGEPVEAEGAQEIAGGKRLLERWLDQLFTALYQDLMCSVIWNAQEQHAAKSGAKVEHTIGDLLRYGYLALRLRRTEDALRAFQQCTSKGFCLRGLYAILDLYAGEGIVEETLATVDAISQFYEINPDLQISPAAYEAVCALIQRYGLSLLNQKGGKWVSKSGHVKKHIDRAVAWRVQGYDK